MALYSELPVYKATYDLLLAIFRFTKDFGKDYKYTVGESLKKETIEKNQRTLTASKRQPKIFLRKNGKIEKKSSIFETTIYLKVGP